MELGDNIWDVEWDEGDEFQEAAEAAGFTGVRGKRLLRRRGALLSSSVWELEPGGVQAPYHFHHGGEELLVVLRGTPTLRSPEGERELREGEVVHFPPGPEGAHQLSNRSRGAGALRDRGGAADSRRSSSIPTAARSRRWRAPRPRPEVRLFTINRLADGVEYFEGESGRRSGG